MEQSAQFSQRPNVVGQSGFHCRSKVKRGMDAAEIVVEEVKCHLMTVVLNFLAVTVREPRETEHPHPHRKVAALYETGRDVLRIGLASEYASATSDTACGAVTDPGFSPDAP